MKAWKKIACAALALAMLMVAGCSGAETSWAYRAGDIQPPIGVYIFYMVSASSEAETKWHEEHDPDEEDHEHPPYKEMLQEKLPDGTTIEEYVRTEADKKMREFIAVEYKFNEQGLSLSEEQTAYAQNTASQSWAGDEENYTRLGVAESSLRQVLLEQFKRDALFEVSYGASGDMAVPEAELEAAFKESYAMVDMMFFHTGESADTAAAIKEAEEYQKRLKAGEDLYELIYEYDLKMAQESGDDAAAIEKPAEGSRSVILSESNRAQYGDTLVDAAMMTAVGETTIATEGSYVYLLRRGDVMANPTNLLLYRSEVLRTLKQEEFDAMLADWAGELNIETNQAALERYQPSKLKIQA